MQADLPFAISGLMVWRAWPPLFEHSRGWPPPSVPWGVGCHPRTCAAAALSEIKISPLLHEEIPEDGYSAKCVPEMVTTRIPIPRRDDPRTPQAASTFKRKLLVLGLDVVRTSPGLGAQFAVAAMLLSRLGCDSKEAAAALILPRLFSTRYWDTWFNQFGIVDFCGCGGK